MHFFVAGEGLRPRSVRADGILICDIVYTRDIACWVIFHNFVAVFSRLSFLKNSFTNSIRVSNCLDPDQDRPFVGPDLGPNCLQKLSADHISRRLHEK